MMDSAVTVLTGSGWVRGVARSGSYAFLGIPFAEAPIGPLRFQAPRRATKWDGVRDARRFGATPQRTALAEVTRIPEPSIPGASTLNVNVFSPSPGAGASLPVVVWIHGGGYVAGSPSSPWYDGQRFNRDGIVTVSISYRLGFDGYGWVEGAPLNRGVLDQIAALTWVQENIAQFGGDPARVTIAGQSAGADAVMRLLTSPICQGLFAAAISHSAATPPTTGGAPGVRERGEKLAATAGVRATTRGFAALTEEDVLRAQLGAAGTLRLGESEGFFISRRIFEGDGTLLGFGPEIDGEVVTMSVHEAILAGVGATKPLLGGSTAEEFLPTRSTDGASAAAGDADFERLARSGVPRELIDRFRGRYVGESAERIAGRIATEFIFRRPLRKWSDARIEAAAAPTWLYEFAWSSPVLGAAVHCLDLPFVWDLLDADGVTAVTGDSPPQSLADEMHGAWVQFISSGTAPWPSATSSSTPGRVFDVPAVPARQILELV